MSTISGVSGSSNAWAALNTQRQARMFAKVDTDGSGSVDQAELSTMLSDVSEKTGVSLGDSKELFTKMDSNNDGSLSSDELAQGMKDVIPPPPSTMDFAQSRSGGDGDSDGPKGPPPPGGPGGPGGAGGAGGPGGTASATGKSGKSDTGYDPLDTNQDGTVSELERLMGEGLTGKSGSLLSASV